MRHFRIDTYDRVELLKSPAGHPADKRFLEISCGKCLNVTSMKRDDVSRGATLCSERESQRCGHRE